jgi:hypothetical protein
VRWNAIIDTSGTPPALDSKARKPGEIEAEITRIANDNGCDVDIWWDRFSWSAYIVLRKMDESQEQHQFNADARRTLEILEAHSVKQWLDLGEKSGHPNAR